MTEYNISQESLDDASKVIRAAWQKELDDEERKVIKKIYSQCFYQETLKKIRNHDFSDYRLKCIEQYKDQFSAPKDVEPKTDKYVVTINIDEKKCGVKELTKQVDKCVKRKIVQAAEWAYEQRSADIATAHGTHVHMIIQRPKDMRDLYFKDQIRETFKHLVGNPKDSHHINFSPIWKDEYVKDKRSYLQGEKTGEGKADKQDVDKLWRIDNNLKDYYETNTKIQCLAQPISTESESEKDDKL